MTIGEPRHAPPALMMQKLVEASAEFGKYPPIIGTPELRQAIAHWIGRRYGLVGRIDPESHVHPLCGSREDEHGIIGRRLRQQLRRQLDDAFQLCDRRGLRWGRRNGRRGNGRDRRCSDRRRRS